ncbi:hypothetical protein H8N03_19370 [Ramlibacter sp. USB13]|uniref:Uncharacterized protein n=1 Tax=Ramlibacter cellulosilyticus TaxID=2764187 RepID=A0A923MUA0_9BURK|nr:hypothetical protein [Ramlibacter cellulosilyticus]MBC5785116.1 hypothetical protein [Ramlibacter cellulosilyticus]
MRQACRSSFRHAAFAAAALLGAAPDAGAVFISTPLGSPPSVTLRVGSANNTINRVTFTVNNANVMPTPTPVIGTPSAGTPPTSPAGGVEIEVITRNTASLFDRRTMRLTVNSSTPLQCVAGSGCGTTVIPFTDIRWTSYNLEAGNNAGQDIQTGSFDGSGAQQLAIYESVILFGFGSSITMRNVLVFQYDNTTLYPSGRYLGRVVYTASNL